jgi:glycosyltransferase involved in cell wall biosynthesis
MRVTFAGPVRPMTGGIAQHSSCTVGALRDAGADVDVVSWAAQYPRVLYKGSGVDPTIEPFAGARFLLRWWSPVSWARAGRIAHRSDLLVMPWVTPVHAVPEWVIHAAAGRPLSLLVHNALPHERMPFDTRLARLVMRRAAHITVHAQTVADAVHELAPAVRVSVVPMPPALQIAPTAVPPRPPLRLLCVGFVRPYKGFDIAVDAVRILRTRGMDVQCTIAGELWEDADEWRSRVADPALGGAVTLDARYIPDDDLAALLASHHIVLAPYRDATQSAVVPVVFAAGRPVVATNVGGLSESLTDGKNGKLVPPGSAEAIADAVQAVAGDLDGYAARAAETTTSWARVAQALLTPLTHASSTR